MVAADLVVLAIDTGKVTAAEENVANTFFSADNRLFTVMDTNRTDLKTGMAAANTSLSMQPVGFTIARTNSA